MGEIETKKADLSSWIKSAFYNSSVR